MKNKLNTNNNVNAGRLELIQKAILTGIGVAASKESIKRAAAGIYNDVQGIIYNLLKDLEKKGTLRTKETKQILKQIQKKSESEKSKIYKKLQKEGKTLLNSAREILSTPATVLKDATNTLNLKEFSFSKKAKTVSKKKTIKKSKKSKKR